MKTIKTRCIVTAACMSIALLTFGGCKETPTSLTDEPSEEGVTDIDGNVYETVIIGSQEWMAENLKTTKYRDGTAIPNVTAATQWSGLSSGAWVWHSNDAAHDDVYGKLYNWYAVDDSRGLCPAGWHVPSDAEWTQLTDFLGGSDVAGGKMKATGTQYWEPPNTGATNESGFSGLPGDGRWSEGEFDDAIGYEGIWWSSSNDAEGYPWARSLYSENAEVYKGNGGADKTAGFSVRCVRD